MGKLYRAGTDCCCGVFIPCVRRVLPGTLYLHVFVMSDGEGGWMLREPYGLDTSCWPADTEGPAGTDGSCHAFFTRAFPLVLVGAGPALFIYNTGLLGAGGYANPEGTAGINAQLDVTGEAPMGGGSYDERVCFTLNLSGGCNGPGAFHELPGTAGTADPDRGVSTVSPLKLAFTSNWPPFGNECGNVYVVTETSARPAMPFYCWQNGSLKRCLQLTPGPGPASDWPMIGGPYASCDDCLADNPGAVCGFG